MLKFVYLLCGNNFFLMSNDEKLVYLYKKYEKYVKRICLRYTKNVEDAEDCMQDTFIKISKVLDNIDLNCCKTYITRIATNQSIDFLRHNKYKKNEDDICECTHGLQNYCTNYDEFQYEDLKDYVSSSLSEKNESYAEIFNMYAIDNYKHKDIAEKCDINVNTVRVNYMKSKKYIKNILQKEFSK